MALSCGRSFTLCVTEDAELFAWGCGMGSDPVLHEQQPAPVGGPASISRAAAGARHHAVVAEDGALYTCGEGRSGPLGLGDGEPRRRLTRVPQAAFGGARRAGQLRRLPHDRCDGRGAGVGLRRERLRAARRGRHHAPAVVHAGGRRGHRGGRVRMEPQRAGVGRRQRADLWLGVFGCLGHNDRQGRVLPTLLCAEPFRASRVASVAAGTATRWPWTTTARCGRGATGHTDSCVSATSRTGCSRRWRRPSGVAGARGRLRRCVHAGADGGGRAVGGRQGARGRLGLADEDDRLVPARVDPRHFAHAPLCAVAAGECHSAAVTAGGELYTWGRGEALGWPSQAPGGWDTRTSPTGWCRRGCRRSCWAAQASGGRSCCLRSLRWRSPWGRTRGWAGSGSRRCRPSSCGGCWRRAPAGSCARLDVRAACADTRRAALARSLYKYLGDAGPCLQETQTPGTPIRT